ncbi:MAG: hypothetical protein WAV40_02760 [Microgenomates group bacterium]
MLNSDSSSEINKGAESGQSGSLSLGQLLEYLGNLPYSFGRRRPVVGTGDEALPSVAGESDKTKPAPSNGDS